ncbi:MAG: ABC transporter ATP-binding protein [Alphaproteobacteria bacterium]|nr:ABC transporter ATP-binding protein [Alphaproteobacteria bacterium]
MTSVIEIKSLSKEYQLGIIGRDTFYRDFQSLIAKILKKDDPNSPLSGIISNGNSNKFLALNKINLDVKKGDIVGIIGKNGAGKSTLLKILSRITSPTEGSIKITGKIASLLEVGTGFHGELTGRENIFLNGAINGMSVSSVEKQLDNIVKFSGILMQHIDTPVKRYSSGMIVKLGFSIAAFLDYDILICDEVLAVGDQEFQNKAINKVKEINSNSNRTVLFVSHNMDSILKLCTKVVIINNGMIVHQGSTKKMVDKYTNSRSYFKNYYENRWSNNSPQTDSIKLISISSKNNIGEKLKDFDITDEILIDVEFQILKNDKNFCTNLHFYRNNNFFFQTFDESIDVDWENQQSKNIGRYKQTCKIPPYTFDVGHVDINILIFNPPGDIDSSNQIMEPKGSTGALSLEIIESKRINHARGNYPFAWAKDSLTRPICKWITKLEDEK